jgi:hypothetical protein
MKKTIPLIIVAAFALTGLAVAKEKTKPKPSPTPSKDYKTKAECEEHEKAPCSIQIKGWHKT